MEGIMMDKKKMKTAYKVKENVVDFLEIPREIALDIPKIILSGRNNIFIENYKGIMLFENNEMKIRTGIGLLSISGRDLIIKEITSENMSVKGEIKSIGFDNN